MTYAVEEILMTSICIPMLAFQVTVATFLGRMIAKKDANFCTNFFALFVSSTVNGKLGKSYRGGGCSV